jgi:hypothetical protein
MRLAAMRVIALGDEVLERGHELRAACSSPTPGPIPASSSAARCRLRRTWRWMRATGFAASAHGRAHGQQGGRGPLSAPLSEATVLRRTLRPRGQ